MKSGLTILLLLLVLCRGATAQADSSRLTAVSGLLEIKIPATPDLPYKYFDKIETKADRYQRRVTKKTFKTLTRLSKWEKKTGRMVSRVNPQLYQKLFAKNKTTFSDMLQKLSAGEDLIASKRAVYDEYRDNLTTRVKYFEQRKDELSEEVREKVSEANARMLMVNKKAGEAANVEKLIKERKNELTAALLKSAISSRYLSKINKETWYYRETLKNYKEIFSTPGRAEKAAKEILQKIPEYNTFVKNNSMLAALFGTPENYGSAESLAGLQTRVQTGALINDKLATGGTNAQDVFKQNMQQAQAELTSLKNKLNKANSKGFSEMPDFKPNTQKTKTFLQRIEYGFNLQFGKANSYLPSTTEISLTAGYKLNDKSIIGIGVAYHAGIGTIDKIKFTHEGLGLQTFVDYKIKKQFYLSGGAEANMQAGLSRIPGLQDTDKWQPAALLGIAKKIPLKTKWTKGTKLQLLYNFLHYRTPAAPQWVFRVGYNF